VAAIEAGRLSFEPSELDPAEVVALAAAAEPGLPPCP